MHKHQLVSSTYHQCVKGRLNGKMIWTVVNLSPFEPAEAHLIETMFYDAWVPLGESLVFKPQGTFVPRWEDIQDDSKLDLRGLLMRKRKWMKAPASESSGTP